MMASADSLICFVGPLPPPVHGFSEINRRMLAVLRCQHQVRAFDMTPRGSRLGFLLVWWRFALCLLRNRPDALYLALSGGLRQWVDVAFVLLARLRGIPVFVHHHSFSYLSQGQLSTAMRLRALRSAVHIVLCECMGQQLVQQYRVDPATVRVLSNAAFLEDVEAHERVPSEPAALRVGFLSNITAEKGIFEFFSVLSQSSSHGLKLQGVIAGPVDASVAESFRTSLALSRNVRHVGSVYGADKAAFFSNVDVLIFPSRLPEAEPVTILEALGQGVPVIAFAQGCIAGMVPGAAGAVFPYSDTFVAQIIETLRPFAEDPAVLEEARRAARLAFESQRADNRAALEILVTEIGGPRATAQVSE